MKVRTLALAAGLSAPLVLAGSASAGFTGLSTVSKPNEFGIFVCNVYAEFDNTEDHLQAVFGQPENPSFINVIDGTFFLHPFHSFGAPNPLLFEVFPELRYDTFFTIGVKSFNPQDPGNPEGQPADNLVFSAGFPLFGESSIDLCQLGCAGYFVVTGEPQGSPFNPDFVAGDGRLLIGQFSTEDGIGIEGQLNLQFVSGRNLEVVVATFQHMLAQPCPWDVAPMGGDGIVGITDFLELLAQWGTDPGGPPDLDGDGNVGINDFLELLANWGPCP